MTTEPLKISGELTSDPDVCKFHLNRTLTEGWSLFFREPSDSRGSPLIDALFDVEGVVQIIAEGSTLTVAKNVPVPWPHLAAGIAKAIRQGFESGAPAISPAVLEALEQLPMEDVAEKIEELFEEHINPALASHGGFVKLVKVEDRDVYVEMGGGCQGCASSKATLRYGVENAIRKVAPQVRRIVDATDHAAGVNPFYKS